jgi:two-component system sensor histidine kinase PilS (NtrC family)
MGPEEDSLQLSTRVSSSGRASVQVWSDGAPMDQSMERHLFEPFFSSESRSSGLGLYICRELCERHGATIDYQRTGRTTQRGDMRGQCLHGKLPQDRAAARSLPRCLTPSLFDCP